MSSGITVAIRIKQQCLKDFIISEYGPAPIQVNNSNKLSSMFIKRLDKLPQDYKPIKHNDQMLDFELPYNDEKNIRCNFFIDEKHQAFIINYFESEFKIQFRLFMNDNFGKSTFQLQDTIFEFTRVYNVECNQDVFDMLKQDYYRYRKRLKKPMLRIRGSKTYREALLKKKTLTTLRAVM